MRRHRFDRNLFVLLLLCAAAIAPSLGAAEPALSTLADASPETRALVAKAVDGYGGASKVASVRLLHVSARLEQVEQSGVYKMAIDSISSFPDRHIAKIRTEQGTMTIAIDEGDAYVIPAKAAVPGAAIRLTPEERDDLIRYFASDPFFVLRNRNSSRFLFAAGEEETVNGVACRTLHVYADGMGVAWLVDLASGRIVRISSGDERSDLSDWKTMGGLTVPERVTTTRGGKLVARTRYAAYDVNPESFDLAESFRKPSLWLMRWKVQPRAGWGSSAGGSSGASRSEAGMASASYRPPDVQTGDASVGVWDDTGFSPE